MNRAERRIQIQQLIQSAIHRRERAEIPGGYFSIMMLGAFVAGIVLGGHAFSHQPNNSQVVTTQHNAPIFSPAADYARQPVLPDIEIVYRPGFSEI